jgi:outer membrane PBP1 activator LpoA protein
MHKRPYLITIASYKLSKLPEFVYRLYSLLFVAVLAITACTTAPERPQPPAEDPLAHAARVNVERGDYLAAAQLYLNESKTAPEKQRIPLRLSAAEYLAQGQLWEQMAQVLDSIDPGRLDPLQQNRYQLLDAQRALAGHQPDVALQLLQKISNPESLPDHGQRYYQLRAEAYAMTGNALEAARQLIWLDGLLEDQQQKLDNQYRIWKQLSTLSDVSLQQLRTSPPPDPLSGWMELVLITRQNRTNRQQWAVELDSWRSRYPGHSAETALLPDILNQVARFGARAKQIAILLPLSGRTGESAAAIRDGIMAAYYQDELETPELRFYDTGGNPQSIGSVYQQAVEDGAEFVLGPLLKDSIQQLEQSAQLPVAVLALNQTGEEHAGELPLYHFGLAPEDEARQVAERTINDGHRQVIALVPDTGWGQRVLTAFQEQLSSLGGEVLETGRYTPSSADFKAPIQAALNLDTSKNRHRSLQRLLGQKLEYEPRRRQDAEAVFLLAFPKQARQIKPQLRFHHAGDIPVYSTSHVFSATSTALIDRDMDGLLFCDIPWVLDDEGPWADQREKLRSAWPGRNQHHQRLFALGFDAYQVIPWLDTLSMPGFASFPGATGILTLDQRKQVHRALEWAQFREGIPQKFTSREGHHEPEEDWQPR